MVSGHNEMGETISPFYALDAEKYRGSGTGEP